MGEQFEEAMKLSELQKSSMKCRRGVRKKESVSKFCNKSIVRCKTLRDDVLNGTYNISPYVEFVIYEPKVRDILATRIRDRVLQDSIVRNGVYYDLTRANIYDNGACQKEKGTSFAINRTRELLRRYYNLYGTNGWACHLDAKKYFPSTPHSVSKDILARRVTDEDFLPFLFDIIDSFVDKRPQDEIDNDEFGARGTGLGSPISQLVQLSLPTDIDHAAKEVLKLKYYVRYNDDVLLWCPDKKALESAVEYLTREAAKLGITVVDKEGIYPIKRGLKFLQLRFILTDTGKIVVRLPGDKLQDERKTLRGMKRQLDTGKIIMKDIEAHYQSWVSKPHCLKAFGAIRAMDAFYTQTFRKKPTYTFKKRRK